jgi:hypothetical protein
MIYVYRFYVIEWNHTCKSTVLDKNLLAVTTWVWVWVTLASILSRIKLKSWWILFYNLTFTNHLAVTSNNLRQFMLNSVQINNVMLRKSEIFRVLKIINLLLDSAGDHVVHQDLVIDPHDNKLFDCLVLDRPSFFPQINSIVYLVEKQSVIYYCVLCISVDERTTWWKKRKREVWIDNR